ncbi:MAG: hydrogenase formation protein HypD [Planctomycetota bacterium]|nr:MAG: hydrogenase formation protein HypD [Planctomycetota bacterium]
MVQTGIRQTISQIAGICKQLDQVSLMEVCGTHTVSLFRSGVKSQLPANMRMISGPGCPVCVTSQGYIDAVCELATREDVAICTYGDMIRVPGRTGSLEQLRGQGADVKVVYSVRDALGLAEKNPERKFVFLAVGFETTAPATAAAVLEADGKNLINFYVLMCHKLVIPAMSALLSAGDVPIDGFICPGHVSVVIGVQAYEPIVENYGKPCVIVGFEPAQMLVGILHLVRQVAQGQARLENVYDVAVTDEGNKIAQQLLEQVFEPGQAIWRAMGTIPASGLELRKRYKRFDALAQFDLTIGPDYDPPGCRCGEVIQGKVEPNSCSLFGMECTPIRPIGPCMVSSEGTCAAWYKYGRHGG